MLFLLAAASACANFGGPQDTADRLATGSFHALGTTQVELQREDLTIDLYRSRARMRIEYDFYNTGADVDIKAGFPSFGVQNYEHKPDYYDVENYQIAVDGKPVSYAAQRGDPKPYLSLYQYASAELLEAKPECTQCSLAWLASTIHFGKGQTRHVTITYESSYLRQEDTTSDVTVRPDKFTYTLSTARAWKGPIQKGRIAINPISLERDPEIRPKNRFKKSGSSWVWEFSNLSPTLDDNLEISLANGYQEILEWYPDDRKTYGRYFQIEGQFWFEIPNLTAAASSFKPGYPPGYATDGRSSTAWVAGGNGIGESLTITFSRPQNVDQVGIEPGYTKSPAVYFANNRVQELEVSVNGGPPVKAVFKDEFVDFGANSPKSYSWVELPARTGVKTVTLTIRKVYPGSKDNDTCISSVRLRKRLKELPNIGHQR